MKHVIVEGPDGAGKTVFARRLCDARGFAYHHEGPPPEGPSALHHYARLLLEAKRPTVFDRFHLGELVYGPILRGRSALLEDDLELMRRLIDGLGATVVRCLPPWGVCEQNLHARELLTEEQRRRAYNVWQYRTEIALHVHLHYDYTYNPNAPVPTRESCPRGVIGSPRARFLLVGERPNGDLDLPFFGHGHSSMLLNPTLASVFHESEFALTNAYNAQGNPRDLTNAALQLTECHVVIPLGQVAADACAEQGVDHFAHVEPMPHPSYWRRFHHHDSRGYVARMRRIKDQYAA